MTTETLKISARSNPSQRIIAAGIVIGFCYFASSVVKTLLLSILLAYLLDPFVEWLERWRVRRPLGALLVLLMALAMVVGLGYLVFDRADHFANDWPKYSAVLKQAASVVERKVERLEARVSELTPQEQQGRTAVRVEEQRPVRSLLLRGIGSLYSVLLTATFVPFLVFFMLAAKHAVWHGTLQLFPTAHRTRVKHALEQVSAMLRGYVVGNVFVAVILALVSWAFFWMIGLEYAFLVGVAGMLSFFHLLAINLLLPALVGKRVHLNALAVTVALLFWGWLWGAMGLILAIPITATLKVICDNVESWQPAGRWLGA